MAYIYFCNNPRNKCIIGDCVIRAISCAMNKSWDTIYIDLCSEGFAMKDLPSANEVFGRYLYNNGFDKYSVSDRYLYTIKDFVHEHKVGTYLLGTGTHLVCAKNGDYLDTWDSGGEIVSFYWKREDF